MDFGSRRAVQKFGDIIDVAFAKGSVGFEKKGCFNLASVGGWGNPFIVVCVGFVPKCSMIAVRNPPPPMK